MVQNWDFLLSEIWGLIALAALVGLFAGWLIWDRSRELRGLRDTLTAREHALATLHDEHEASKVRFERERATLTSERDEARVEVGEGKARLVGLEEALAEAKTSADVHKKNYVEACATSEKATADLRAQAAQVTDLERKVQDADRRAAEMGKYKVDHDAAVTAKGKAQNAHAEEIARVRRRDEELARLKTELNAAQTEARSAATLRSDLSAAQLQAGKVVRLEEEVARQRGQTGRIQTLERELEAMSSRASKAERALEVSSNKAAQVSSLQASVAAKDARIKQLEQVTQTAQKSNSELIELREGMQHRDAIIADLRARMHPAGQIRTASNVPDYDGDGVHEGRDEGKKPATLTMARGGRPDDLKLIKGVGPKLEEMLHELGFFHFDQVASWTNEEVAWVDANLDGFNGRVSRDAWIDQARILARGGETEFSARAEQEDIYRSA